MIINVPIYLEVNGRFTPEEGRELSIAMRRALFEFVRKQSGGFFKLETSDGIRRVEILSEQQAVNRFGSKQKLTPSTPPKEKPFLPPGF